MNGSLIITGQITLCGVLLALLTIGLNHLLANTQEKKKERLANGKDVIAAFKNELDSLHQTNDDCLTILTREAYRQHESAIRSYLPYLSWINRFRLKKAWHCLAFHEKDKKGTIPYYEQYADSGSLSKRRSVRPKVIRKIEKIISFANK